MKKVKTKVIRYQGRDEENQPFGYVESDDNGGYFFTWLDTLDATLDSLEGDEVDPPTHDFSETARVALAQNIGDDFTRLCEKIYEDRGGI